MKSSEFLSKQNTLKLVFESILIVFSVLLALLLNEYKGYLKEKQQRQLVIEMIQAELISNLNILNEQLPYHEEVLNNLNSALDSDSLRNTLITDSGVVLWSLIPRGVVQKLVDDTSWQTAKSSTIFSSLELTFIFEMSELYRAQELGIESTLKNILSILSSRESLDTKQLNDTLLLLRNAFGEIVSQERFLIEMYKQKIDGFEKVTQKQ